VAAKASSVFDGKDPLSLFGCTVFKHPVGARLLNHVPHWKEITNDPWVLKIVTEGYRIPFEVLPPLACVPPPILNSANPALHEEVTLLLLKDAIRPAPLPLTPGFYSSIFVVPKKTGGNRLIFNLKILNTFISRVHFKMETLKSIREAVSPNDWSVSLDLTDAYLHVPIHPDSQHLLRFVHRTVVYQFRALPFGLTTAPMVFTMLMKPILAWTHQRGLCLHAYLDDWLLRQQNRAMLITHLTALIHLLTRLGLGVNPPKSRLLPAQQFDFLGASFDTVTMTITPTAQRTQALIAAVKDVYQAPSFTARNLAACIGKLDSVADLVPHGRWMVRPFHWARLDNWSPTLNTYEDVLLPTILPDLSFATWWTDPANLSAGVPIQEPIQDHLLFTDASETAWGARLTTHSAAGRWSTSEQQLHINVLELLAVLRALQSFTHLCSGRRIQAQIDNTTAVCYLRRGGGTHSRNLQNVAWQIFLFCKTHQIALTSLHIPGKLNVEADALSRLRQLPTTEWTLRQDVCNRLFQHWGCPALDLFATIHNRRLPAFVSPLPHPLAWATDALALDWDGFNAYLFPPFATLLRILRKVKDTKTGVFILIAPCWPAQPWFPMLLDLLIDHPITLPAFPDLLTQGVPRQAHPYLSVLHLHAWKLSSEKSRLQAFRDPLPSALRLPFVTQQPPSTTLNGIFGAIGVSQGKQIHPIQLL